MPSLDYRGSPLPLNEHGFLVDPEEWNEDVALLLARDQDGLTELTKAHWAVLHYIRDFWLEHDRAPMIRYVCKHSGQKLKTLYELFPSGPAQGACKVAGLSSPDGCV